jgi:hypothetical protein
MKNNELYQQYFQNEIQKKVYTLYHNGIQDRIEILNKLLQIQDTEFKRQFLMMICCSCTECKCKLEHEILKYKQLYLSKLTDIEQQNILSIHLEKFAIDQYIADLIKNIKLHDDEPIISILNTCTLQQTKLYHML